MISLTEKLTSQEPWQDELILPFERRQRSRLRVTLASGGDAALMVERGTVLRGGDLLRASDGRVIRVVAADEPTLRVTAANATELARAAYHLGNRHVPLQVGDGWLRLEQDHVLQDMLIGLGASVTAEQAPFEPEAGAYGGGHRHGHGHDEDERPSVLNVPTRLRKSA